MFIKLLPIKIALASTVLFVPMQSFADKTHHPTTRYLLGMAATTGGDKLLEVDVVFEDGDTNSNNIKAGALLYFYGGMYFSKAQSPWSGQVTLGYHFDGVFTKEDSVKFSRYPLDILLTRHFGKHALSVGVTRHFSPEADAKDIGLSKVEFDDATGVILQYQYFSTPTQSLGLRYTSIDYALSDDFADTEVDGNSIGLTITGYF